MFLSSNTAQQICYLFGEAHSCPRALPRDALAPVSLLVTFLKLPQEGAPETPVRGSPPPGAVSTWHEGGLAWGTQGDRWAQLGEFTPEAFDFMLQPSNTSYLFPTASLCVVVADAAVSNFSRLEGWDVGCEELTRVSASKDQVHWTNSHDLLTYHALDGSAPGLKWCASKQIPAGETVGLPGSGRVALFGRLIADPSSAPQGGSGQHWSWRVTNAGFVQSSVRVPGIELFSDTRCSRPVSVTGVTVRASSADGSVPNLMDESPSTYWQPSSGPALMLKPRQVWIEATFPTLTAVRCAQVPSLGLSPSCWSERLVETSAGVLASSGQTFSQANAVRACENTSTCVGISSDSSEANYSLVEHFPREPWQGLCDERLHDLKGVGYRGCQNKTRSGSACQPWAAQDGLDSNYCRNPDGARTIWCRTTLAGALREFCDPLSSPLLPTRHVFKFDRTCFEHPASGLILPYSALIPCLLYTSPSPRDRTRSRMPSSA
eukprot:TRINITY_DN12400_c0_g1_i3.p1 TRINITY_DN12400_c0_g1~~TRINITY_DN12400_c0_g1_i3.p1  ORF type:complete len:490 (+),score=62.12 TRINITY_DN12400_c0_g1_i3:493-1962(+)